jgi:hypothetical protein
MYVHGIAYLQAGNCVRSATSRNNVSPVEELVHRVPRHHDGLDLDGSLEAGIWHVLLRPARLHGKDPRLVALAMSEADLLAPDFERGVIETEAKVLKACPRKRPSMQAA